MNEIEVLFYFSSCYEAFNGQNIYQHLMVGKRKQKETLQVTFSLFYIQKDHWLINLFSFLIQTLVHCNCRTFKCVCVCECCAFFFLSARPKANDLRLTCAQGLIISFTGFSIDPGGSLVVLRIKSP